MKTRTIVLAGLCLATTPALAVRAPEDPTRTHAQNGVVFRSGGVGLEERDALRRTSGDFDLKLEFAEAEPRRHYVAGVRVVIEDLAGTMLVDAVTQGPWFFARLREGEYLVRASYGGRIEEKRITVSAEGQRQLTFLW
ncbi:MAG: carboxypeptidase regulatory-like domain-containing protein [Candidatus Binatia bacterium]